jgi:uroporphyrinogen decarboxylase
MKKILIETLSGTVCERAPFWFFRQAGRYLPEYREIRKQAQHFLDFCYRPELAVEATLQPIRRFNMDAAILFSDILVVPDALGVKVTFEQGEGPRLEKTTSEKELSKLSLENLKNHLVPVYETVSELRQKLPKDKTLIGFSGSPWTLACYMVEGKGSRNFEEAVALSTHSPTLFNRLIEILTEAVILHLEYQIEAGAEVVQLFDSWAGAAPLSQFENYVMAPTKKIVSTLKAKYPHVPVMGFPRGAGANIPRFANETKIDGVSVDQFTSISFVKENVNCVVQGNLDPALLAYGTKEQILAASKTLQQSMRGKPYIFNLGHGIIQHTPPENMEALCAWLKQQ